LGARIQVLRQRRVHRIMTEKRNHSARYAIFDMAQTPYDEVMTMILNCGIARGTSTRRRCIDRVSRLQVLQRLAE
jgi:hypothetical protein